MYCGHEPGREELWRLELQVRTSSLAELTSGSAPTAVLHTSNMQLTTTHNNELYRALDLLHTTPPRRTLSLFSLSTLKLKQPESESRYM